ncbi:MAG: UvrD-helicase domain-containing protein [Bacteroidetes bacterium]|nr:UvrD-helicase domain-containing protein [Bacteroidota bacterium]
MSDYLAELNERQAEAVLHADGPLLIIAGAGSGKTRVLTYRIAQLLASKKAWASQILALTFTNKAAREMRERIEHIIGEEANRLWMGTFHSLFTRILRMEAEHIGFQADFSIYDSDDSDRVVKGILQELGMDPREIKPKQIRFRISSAKNQMIGPEEYATKWVQSSIDDITAQVYKIYNNRLKQSNAMDFDDLLIKPIELFETHPEILEKYQDRFKYIMIDEYQDTNRAQYIVTKMLAAKHENICVVGDDAQSIYSFRGADISNILSFKDDYATATQISLEQNYRSTQSILKCADAVIKQNKKQLEKTLWTQNNKGNPITLLDNFSEREEAQRVADHIRKIHLTEGYRFNEIAILYRTNYQSRVFEESLRRKDVPYQLVGGVSFYQRKEVKDVIAYLRLLVNPNDEEAVLRVINEPARGIGMKSLQTLVSTARVKEIPVWEVLSNPVYVADVYKPAQAKIREFIELMNESREQLPHKALVDTTRDLLEKTGYVKQFVEENTAESLGRRENVMELLNAISYFERSRENASLSAFLQEVSLVSDVDNMEENVPAVTLMTVHASKGLEFPVVFVVGMEEELFPMGGRNGEEADIEEERRLFYVAITRAQKELYFSFARSRYRFGEEKPGIRSRFLDEVDPAVVRNENGSTIKQKSDTTDHRPSGSFIEYDYTKPLNAGYPGATPPPDSAASSSPKRRTIYTRNGQGATNAPSTNMGISYESAETEHLKPGVFVMHEKFGAGKILQREGQGADTKLVVFFQNHGQKKLALKFAKLRILS